MMMISLLPLLLIGSGFLIGQIIERRHLKSLQSRELALQHLVVTDLKNIPNEQEIRDSVLVMGEAVIATDYFKMIAMQLRNLVGGEVRSLQTLVDRARREALLRMLEHAQSIGATEVHNVRLETSNVLSANPRNKGISVEMFAFGTAIKRTA